MLSAWRQEVGLSFGEFQYQVLEANNLPKGWLEASSTCYMLVDLPMQTIQHL